MSEFMGLIEGVYDAKPGGFLPAGMSLHNAMLPHGPDAEAFERAAHADLAPARQRGTPAFMFETRVPQPIPEFAAAIDTLEFDYQHCWAGIQKHYTGSP